MPSNGCCTARVYRTASVCYLQMFTLLNAVTTQTIRRATSILYLSIIANTQQHRLYFVFWEYSQKTADVPLRNLHSPAPLTAYCLFANNSLLPFNLMGRTEIT